MDVSSPFHFSLHFLKDKLTHIFPPLCTFACIIRNCNNFYQNYSQLGIISLFITIVEIYHSYKFALTFKRPYYERDDCPLGEESENANEEGGVTLAGVHNYLLVHVVLQIPKVRFRVLYYLEQLAFVHQRNGNLE